MWARTGRPLLQGAALIDDLTDKHLDALRRVHKRPVWSVSRLPDTHPGVTVGALRSLARRGFLAEQRGADHSRLGYTITALGRAQVEQRKAPRKLTRVRRLPTDEELEREGLK